MQFRGSSAVCVGERIERSRRHADSCGRARLRFIGRRTGYNGTVRLGRAQGDGEYRPSSSTTHLALQLEMLLVGCLVVSEGACRFVRSGLWVHADINGGDATLDPLGTADPDASWASRDWLAGLGDNPPKPLTGLTECTSRHMTRKAAASRTMLDHYNGGLYSLGSTRCH